VTTIFKNLSPENKALNPKSSNPLAQPHATIVPGKGIVAKTQMPSAKQVLAAQTNGRKSQGPKTAEGRRKSSANSRKHGLYGKDIQTDDACEAYRQWLLHSLIAKYLPANPAERDLVETIALACARQNWAIRTSEAHFAQAIEAQANPDAAYQHPGRNTLFLLHRLENRFYRQETRARETLLKIRRPAKSAKLTNEPDSIPAKMQERTLSPTQIPAPPVPANPDRTPKCAHRPHRNARGQPKPMSRPLNPRFNPAKSPLPTPGMLRWA
jgi:hypothetical protein